MKNIINYYYNLNPAKISKMFNKYYFYINNELYFFIIYSRKIEDAKSIFDLNINMINDNVMVNEIINNRDNSIITWVNDIPYVLMKVQINLNKSINLSEINYLSHIRVSYPNNLMRSNWANLWTKKIDYLEYLMDQNKNKYPIIMESFDYFVGMAENAISYLNDTVISISPGVSDVGVISHDRLLLNDTIYSLYDPLNIIIDHPARDLSEYIKNSFLKDNYNIFDELDIYFKNNYYSFFGICLLVSRLLYPSFYFECIDQIMNKEMNESYLLNITSRISDYEIYLNDIFNYLKKFYNFKDINWIKNRR